LSLGQNFAVPTSNLVIRNLELVGRQLDAALEASFTPNLRIENVRIDVSQGKSRRSGSTCCRAPAW
jgi:hypothetical protein